MARVSMARLVRGLLGGGLVVMVLSGLLSSLDSVLSFLLGPTALVLGFWLLWRAVAVDKAIQRIALHRHRLRSIGLVLFLFSVVVYGAGGAESLGGLLAALFLIPFLGLPGLALFLLTFTVGAGVPRQDLTAHVLGPGPAAPMGLVPEGRPFIAIGLALTVALAVVAWAWPAWSLAALATAALTAGAIVVFRDPERPGPRGDRLVLAPADGRVASISTVEEGTYLRRRATRIAVVMGRFDVHVSRFPVAGRLDLVRSELGADDEEVSLGIAGPLGPVLIQGTTRRIGLRSVTDVVPGHVVVQGERFGMIFGGLVELYFTPDTALRAAVGEEVRAGQTVLAEYVT